MSDRILDMQARISGARQVERELQGLEAGTKKVESAAASAAGGEKGLADALRERSEAAGKALESTEKTFAATDRLQSIVGKVTGVIGLATLAIGAATAAYQALTPEVDLLSTKLDEQARRAKQAEAALKSLTTVQGSTRFVRPDDLVAEVKATKELNEAQAERLLLATQQLEAQEALEDAGRRLGEVNANVATSEDDKARALQGFLARTTELNGRIIAFRDAQVAAADREADAETRLIKLREDAQRAAASGLATVPFEPGAGGGAAPPGPRGARGPQAPRGDGLSFPQLNSEFIAGLRLPGGEDPFGGPERISEAQDLADGIANVVGQLEQLQSAELAVAEARKQGTAVALGYAEAAAKAGAAAALSAALRGESVAEAVNAVLQGVAVEATVEAAFEVAKGLAALANPLTAPTAAGHFAAAKAFGVTAAIAGVGAAATGGFGGGGGGGSPADVSPPGGPRGESAFGRDRGAGGDTYIMNNNLDLRTRPLATNRELARELTRVQSDFARLPGSGRR